MRPVSAESEDQRDSRQGSLSLSSNQTMAEEAPAEVPPPEGDQTLDLEQ